MKPPSGYTQEQWDMLVEASKPMRDDGSLRRLGPPIMSPADALEAVEAQRIADKHAYNKRLEEIEFQFRNDIEHAMRRGEDRARWDIAFMKNAENPGYVVMVEQILPTLINKGWHARVKSFGDPKNLQSRTILLRWSTKPFTWWQKLWM